MTMNLAQAGVEHGRCRRCDHDLQVCVDRAEKIPAPLGATHVRGESDGRAYCSNFDCRHFHEPHFMSSATCTRGAEVKFQEAT